MTKNIGDARTSIFNYSIFFWSARL